MGMIKSTYTADSLDDLADYLDERAKEILERAASYEDINERLPGSHPQYLIRETKVEGRAFEQCSRIVRSTTIKEQDNG